MTTFEDIVRIGAARSPLRRALASLASELRAWSARARRAHLARRRAAETRESLRALDERALRDLGISAEEIESIAAEVAGDAEPTRVRASPGGPR